MPVQPRTDRIVPLLLILTAVTGLLDAIAVLGLGRVFSANMTGNIIYLGFALTGLHGFTWHPYVVAIAFFLIGAAAAARLARRYEGSRRAWLLRGAGIESGLVLIAAAVSFVLRPAANGVSVVTLGIIALTAIAMGVRNSTVRKLAVPDLTTTVLTMGLVGLASDSVFGGGAGTNQVRRIAAVVAFLLGVTSGALLFQAAGLTIPLTIAGIVTLSATFLLA